MKKYLFFLAVVFGISNSYAEDVVLSDTSVDSDGEVVDVATSEESFVAPATATNTYSSGNGSYVSKQIQPAVKNTLSNDTSDPLFLIGDDHFLFDTHVASFDRKLRLGQYIGYGVNQNLALHADVLYQWDFSGNHENGFSSTEIGGTYRMNHGTGEYRIISDALFGLKLGGSSHVRTPEYADSSYYAGLRFGRQFAGLTLSGTIKSTWVFDDERGLSYLDFIPEAYFRMQYDWRIGVGFDLRKSTNSRLLDNQQWLNLKLLRQYGNTQYVARCDYEFESGEVLVGVDVKVLF